MNPGGTNSWLQFTGCINPFTPWPCFGENIYFSLTLKSLACVVCGSFVERETRARKWAVKWGGNTVARSRALLQPFFPLPSSPPKKPPATQAIKLEDEILWCSIPFKWKHSGRKFAGRRLHDTCIGSVSSSGASKKRGKARLARFRLLDFLYGQIFIEWERRFGMRQCFGLFYREYGEKSVRITGGGWHGVEA